MGTSAVNQVGSLRLERFDPNWAVDIARWIKTKEELRLLAPSTSWPITVKKVLAWKRPAGAAWVLTDGPDREPIAYAEMNPMRGRPEHLWLGHILVRPDQRGKGTGCAFVRALVRMAFEDHAAEKVILVVFPNNVSAIRCYEKAGFHLVGEERHRFGDSGPMHRLYRLEVERPREGLLKQRSARSSSLV